MPGIEKHQSLKTIKLLVLGDSGSGKSGAGASLAAAGYNVRYLDLDNGLDVVRNVLLDPKSKYPKEAASRVQFETITDQMRTVGGKLMPAQATVWDRAMGLLNNWSPSTTKAWPNKQPPNENDTAELGHLCSWTEQDVLIVDSLTFLSLAALNKILALNMRLGQKPWESDWGDAQELVHGFLQMLYDTSVRCNVVVNTHIMYQTPKGTDISRGYPMTLGKALSPKVGRYFNSMVMTQTTGAGPSARRKLTTNPTSLVELKASAPLRVKAEYGIENGLAELFKDLRGE